MYKSYSMELAGRTLTVDIGRVCAQANGAALLKYGETTVLSTATASDKPRDGVDFFPLSVEFEEEIYWVGKIPGGKKIIKKIMKALQRIKIRGRSFAVSVRVAFCACRQNIRRRKIRQSRSSSYFPENIS